MGNSTFGPTFDEEQDGDRIRTQLDRVRELMLDGVWRTHFEISRLSGDLETSISAQLRHLRKTAFGSFTVDARRRDGDESKSGLWEYRVVTPTEEEVVERAAEEKAQRKNAALKKNIIKVMKDLDHDQKVTLLGAAIAIRDGQLQGDLFS